MYLQFILLLIAALLVTWPTYSVNNDWYANRIIEVENVNTLMHVERAINLYFDETFSYPDLLSDLNDGKNIIQILPNQSVLYKKIDVTDSRRKLVYQKYIIALSKNRTELDSTYLLDNRCGNKPFTSGDTFCGSPSSNWLVNDSRSKIEKMVSTQSERLNYTAQRFFEASELPSAPTASNKATPLKNTLDNGQSVNCYGPNKFKSVSLSCLDVFSVTGGDVFYQLDSKSEAHIFAVMPFRDENGQSHIVAKELRK